MSQPLVLAIEPDLRQAAIVKRIVREKVLADVAVVDSRDAAIEAMRTAMPDVLLLSALMSPRDEDELVAHLKTLDNAGHLQTHTIPQLASALDGGEERASRGLLSAFRRKKDPAPMAAGCDPELFAEEIRVFLQRAADKKRQLQNTDFTAPDMRPAAVATTRAAAASSEETAAAEPSSSWSSPFEWKPAGSSARATRPVEEAPIHAAPAVPETPVEASTAESIVLPAPEPALVEAPPMVAEAPPVVEAPPLVLAAPPVVEPAPVVVAAPPPEPVLHAVAHPVTAPEPEPVPVAAAPVIAKAPAPEPARPKPVADRPAKLTGRIQLHPFGKGAAKDRDFRDRLGPLARWARIEAPRGAKPATANADDVRALISSLAVPPAVASVTYPRGCRIRRLRVPVSPDGQADSKHQSA